MRIVQVNKFYDLRGGTERVMHDLLDGLHERGHDTAVFACTSRNMPPTPWRRYFLPERDYENPGPLDRVRHAVGTIYDLGARKAFERLLDDFAPDVVHAHNVYHQLSPSVLDACRARRIPVVLTLHDYKLVCPVYRLFRDGEICEDCVGVAWPRSLIAHRCSRGSLAESALLAVEHWAHRRRRSYARAVHTFVSPSVFLRDTMIRGGFDPAQLEVIANAPRRRPRSAELELRDARPTVLYAGRLSEEKGVELLIDAAREAPDTQVRIAGDGPLERSLKARAADLANVHFLGRLDAATLEAERGRAWAIAVPSVWYENAPLSVIESFWSARPVLAAAHGGLAEMMRDGENGWVVARCDREAWIEILRRVPEEPDALAAMGRRAREDAERRYEYEEMLAHYLGVYERAVKER